MCKVIAVSNQKGGVGNISEKNVLEDPSTAVRLQDFCLN